MILKDWAAEFRKIYGDVLPRDYLSIDCETTGFSRQDDLIWEWGHTVVRNGRSTETYNMVIDWTAVPDIVEPAWLDDRIAQVRRQICYDHAGKPTGKKFRLSRKRLAEEGIHPFEAFAYIGDILNWARHELNFFVGQNVWNFDVQILAEQFSQFSKVQWEFWPNEVFDTGALYKASLISPPLIPFRDETLKDFFQRVIHKPAKGLRWNIEACALALGLDKRGIELDKLHGAGPDSYYCHRIFEEVRRRIEI